MFTKTITVASKESKIDVTDIEHVDGDIAIIESNFSFLHKVYVGNNDNIYRVLIESTATNSQNVTYTIYILTYK